MIALAAVLVACAALVYAAKQRQDAFDAQVRIDALIDERHDLRRQMLGLRSEIDTHIATLEMVLNQSVKS